MHCRGVRVHAFHRHVGSRPGECKALWARKTRDRKGYLLWRLVVVRQKNVWVRMDRFDGGCAPPNPAPLAAAGVRGELLQGRFASRARKWKRAGQPTRIAFTPARFVNITLTSILRRVLPLKGFCYRWARWEEFSQGVIEIGIEARKGAQARCRCCQKPAPVYDARNQPRRWRFTSVWAIAVFLVYRPRRVECPRCGVHVEHLPWASGKLQLCDALRLFLAQWARLPCLR